MRYEIHNLTGSTLIDASGRRTGNESAGRVSTHKTREAAERALERLRKISPAGPRMEIREV